MGFSSAAAIAPLNPLQHLPPPCWLYLAAMKDNGLLVPAIIGSALFMQTLDATIIANALPTMAQSLHEDPLKLNLAISSYFLSTAVFLPLSGWAADRFGSRRVLSIAIALFALSSLLCGLSQNLYQLVAARILQGMAGATMAPVGRLVLLKTVPKSDLVRATAVLTMPALLGPIIGPVVGGAIVTFADWRWIFYINIPMGVLGITLVNTFVPNIIEANVARLDLRGFVLIALGLAGLVFGLENAGSGALPLHWVAVLIGGGAISLLGYYRHARNKQDTIVNLALLRIPTFVTALVGGGFTRLVLGASPFLLAILLQVVFGMSAFAAGLMTFTSAAGALFMKTTAPPIIRRFGFRRILIVNTIITALVLMCYALFTATTPYAVVVAVLFCAGFFRSLQFTALGAMAFADIPHHQMSGASSLSSVGQQLSQAIGVALAAFVLYMMQRSTHSPRITAADITPAFIVVGVLSLIALFFFVRLPRNAAEEVSGHRAKSL
jgi:EmrB/QacA subfamily drug resistance transporter